MGSAANHHASQPGTSTPRGSPALSRDRARCAPPKLSAFPTVSNKRVAKEGSEKDRGEHHPHLPSPACTQISDSAVTRARSLAGHISFGRVSRLKVAYAPTDTHSIYLDGLTARGRHAARARTGAFGRFYTALAVSSWHVDRDRLVLGYLGRALRRGS